MLVRKRPTPGTPMAKSASFFSANSLTCRGVMICSARCLSSSGRTGSIGSECRSPLTRMVGGRPTLRCRSEPPRCTICEIACLKLKGAAVGSLAKPVVSAIGIDPEENLAELYGLGVFHAHFADDSAEFGFDFVHDLHRLDNADRLPRADAGSYLDVGIGSRLRGGIEGPHHRRLDLFEPATRRRGAWCLH